MILITNFSVLWIILFCVNTSCLSILFNLFKASSQFLIWIAFYIVLSIFYFKNFLKVLKFYRNSILVHPKHVICFISQSNCSAVDIALLVNALSCFIIILEQQPASSNHYKVWYHPSLNLNNTMGHSSSRIVIFVYYNRFKDRPVSQPTVGPSFGYQVILKM